MWMLLRLCCLMPEKPTLRTTGLTVNYEKSWNIQQISQDQQIHSSVFNQACSHFTAQRRVLNNINTRNTSGLQLIYLAAFKYNKE